MSGNKIGGQKARDKNLANDPDFYKKIGSRGGKAFQPDRGFARSHEHAAAAGRLGGLKSRRTAKSKV